MKKHTKLSMAFVAAFVLLAMASSASAITSDDSDNSTVTVNVASKIAVDISPSDLEYTGMNPGDRLTNTTNGPGDGYTAIEVENIGSQNVSQVWLNATAPDSNPFGSGVTSNYDAGNFIQVAPSGDISGVASDNSFTFVNRKEFNESNDLSYVFTPQDGHQWDYGRFRAGDQEFFWAVNASGGTCQTGTDQFRVGNSAHNKTETGSTNFRTGGDWTGYSPSNTVNGHLLVPNVQITPPKENTRTYDVLASCGGQETYTVRTRYNPKATGASDLTLDGSAAQHLLNSSTGTQDSLQPGEHFQVNTSVEVPQGVPQSGDITGLLRVFVKSL